MRQTLSSQTSRAARTVIARAVEKALRSDRNARFTASSYKTAQKPGRIGAGENKRDRGT